MYKDTIDIGIYTRLSRDPDGTQTATARQASDCRELAAREGWRVVETYEDSDLSGYRRGVIRPDFERMLADVSSRRIRAIVVWKLDRLSRQPGQFEQVLDACALVGARIFSVHESADMTSPMGLAMMRIGMTFAALESETISLRTRRAKAEAADAGLPNGGGLRPFGLSKSKTELVPAEAALIREAAGRVIGGEGLRQIAADWEARGVVSSRGNPWTITALRRMLVNPRLSGARVHRGRVVPSDVIPAILEPAVAERVRHLLTREPASAYARQPRALSGLVRCSLCGERMKVKRRQKGDALYRCFRTPGQRACGRMVVTAEPLEELVGAALAEALSTPLLGAAIAQGEPSGEREELAALQERREALVNDHYVEGRLSRSEFLAAHAALTNLISASEDALGRQRQRELLGDLDPGETVAAAWSARDPVWKRAFASAYLERVVISPAAVRGRPRFDPARVELVWRR
ncbi:recombinase family protein [Miltoncostaea marina]|uniref:recombinase family protein n=1 Tax=Miltoncostaea marina TaxID=2843215 RepID=UPI001C3D5A3D|nr:recombinase family protein [Miltoncostaea marina]